MRERKSGTRVQTRQIEQVDVNEPLARKASGEILDELHLMELQLLRAYKAHLAAQARASRPASTPEKDRILRGLRRLDD